MPWCPGCQCEYPHGAQACPACGASLPHMPQREPGGYAEPVLLLTLRDLEADQVEALLRTEGIPVQRRYRHPAGHYLTLLGGRTRYDAELYVPAELLAKAKEALLSLGGFQPAGAQPPPGEEAGGEAPSRDMADARLLRRLVAWVLILVFVFATVVMAFVQIPAFIRTLGEMLAQI